MKHWSYIILFKNYMKNECLLDPKNIYCLYGTIGLIGVNLESVILCNRCAIQMI